MLTPLGHFLSNIRQLQMLAETKGHNVRMNQRAKDDLELAKKFITRAKQGVSMNLLTFRTPDIVYICDASEYGLGGFASHGRAWTYQIPIELRNRAHINILEYLAQIIIIWIDIIEGSVKSEDCILSIGDNTSSLGWMRRSNFRQKGESDTAWEVKQQLGRHLASLTLGANIVLYKQWLRGHDNLVADSLSSDNYYMNANTHTKILQKSIPQQLPQNFHIRPIPREISCYITSMLQQLPEDQPQTSRPKPSELAYGIIGILTSIVSESVTCTSTDSQSTKGIRSYQHSPKQFESAPSLKEIVDNWWKGQSQPPLHMWLRPSGQTTGKTQDWTMMTRHALCCRSNTEATGIQMDQRGSRKHSLSQ